MLAVFASNELTVNDIKQARWKYLVSKITFATFWLKQTFNNKLLSALSANIFLVSHILLL